MASGYNLITNRHINRQNRLIRPAPCDDHYLSNKKPSSNHFFCYCRCWSDDLMTSLSDALQGIQHTK